MNKASLSKVINSASIKTGLPLTAEGEFFSASQPITIRIVGLSQVGSFYFLAHRTPMTWVIDLCFDTFSAPIIREIAILMPANRTNVLRELDRIEREGVIAQMNLTDFADSYPSESDWFPPLTLRLISGPPTDQNRVALDEEVNVLTELLESALILVYLTLGKESADDLLNVYGEMEGSKEELSCSRYTRSPQNRKRCLDLFGFICQACGLDPAALYGPIGKRIIHVHHRTPLALMDGPAPVSPETDLVPLCPNCHNFAHKQSPPFGLEEIQKLIEMTGSRSTST